MDRKTVFTKTAKGLMEATGKTSVLPRDLRALLKEIDGKTTVGEVQARLDKMSEAKLLEILNTLAASDFIREFTRAPQPPQRPAADDMNLDFTTAIPTISAPAKKAEEAARQQAKADAEAKARAAAAEAAARARADAEARAKRDADEQARRAAEERARKEAEARAQAEVQARIEAEARARKDAEEHARVEAELKAKLEDERKAREEAERKAKAEAERERREAEEKAQREADALRAKLEEERQAREEAERKAKAEAERERREAEEKAQREADALRAKLEEERQAREEAERKAKAEAERERREAEEKAQRQADALRARLEEERKAKAEAERERREAEEKARREADELRAKLEEERQAREEAERRAKAETERERKQAEDKAQREADALRARLDEERQAREDAERRAKEQAERKASEDAERKAKEQADRVAREAEERAREEQQELARREAEARAREESEERSRREAEARARQEQQELARREAETRARDEAEAQARNEAAENARREAAEQARSQAPPGSGASLEDLVKIETDFDAVLGTGGGPVQAAANISADADAKLLQEAEAKTRRQAEEQARTKAEEQARRAAEAKAERDAEERRRKDEEEQRRKRAEVGGLADPAAREREHAEAQARIRAENDETERHFAEMEKELEAEAAADEKRPAEFAWDARKHARAEAALEEAPAVYRTPIKWGKPVALGLFLILMLALVLVHFISFDAYIPQFEKLAGAHLQQPVKIKSLHLSLVPLPHWRLDGVSVGEEGQLAAARINAVAELGSMFSEQKVFKSIELESPVLSEQGLLALLFGKPQGQAFKVTGVTVRNGKLNSKTFILPALDAKIAFGENGAWQKIALETPDHKTSLLLAPKNGAVQVEVETNAFTMPFGPAFILENFVAKGVIGRDELRLSEFKGGMYGGYLSGSANLKWGAGWSLGGDISARAIEPGRIAPTLVEDGKLEGKAVYAMRAKSYDELFAAPRLDGTFALLKGSLLGVDLARLLQGGGVGGKTAFAEVTGSFIREGGRTQLRQVRLVAGPVSATGNADADAAKNISGRFAVDLKSPVVQARANLVLSGTLREPHFNR